MCGIAGIVNLNGHGTSSQVIRHMAGTLSHRGPDATGWHCDTQAHLACCRLAIIDQAGGHQPLYDSSRQYVIVYNGEIYNYQALRHTLEQHGNQFQTRSDTEVVLTAYRQWGVDCLARLKGMFALAIWQPAARCLFLARDRLGIKPLYYTYVTGVGEAPTLVFGSEIKALLEHPDVTASLYPPALHHLLTFGFNLAPATFFEGIQQLLPGHFMLIRPQQTVYQSYWDIELSDRTAGSAADEDLLASQLREKLQTAVQDCQIADVPVAAYLSGGIDSSAVAGLYASLSEQPVTTFSITFREAGYDEAVFARQVADRFRTRHIEFGCEVEPADIRQMVYHIEEPMVTLLHLPLLLLSRQVARHGFKVVISGDGADEMLAGYDYFKLIKMMAFIERHPGSCRKSLLRRLYPHLISDLQANIQHLVLDGYPCVHPALPYRFQAFPFMGNMLSEAFKATRDEVNPDPFFFDLASLAQAPLLDQALYMESKMRLLNLTLPLADKMSMASGVELRPAFLDHELVEFAFTIPARLKLRGLEEKYILKKSMADFLPPAICQRRKQPLQPPGAWFVRTQREMIQDLLSESMVRQKGYFDSEFISTILQQHFSGEKNDFSGTIIVAFMVHLWDDMFI